ncbi:MAG: stealth family protein [Weeksellaceae bacterium]
MDFVITWVDGNDPKWKNEFVHYKEDDNQSTHHARFRDWDNLQYWFRGVERFAPWVDKIHLVTFGHLPVWLNTNHPKLNIVKHEDFIPKEYLPTFNSHTIELNFHRINGLSEEFVYFNDDVFLLNPIEKDFFFHNGLPCDMPLLETTTGWNFNIILFRALGIINQKFILRKTVSKAPIKWFHPKYGKNAVKNFLYFVANRNTFPGFFHFHLALPIKKSTLEIVWNHFPEVMNESCEKKFRNYYTVNLSLQRYWELASNNFHPVDKRKWGRVFELVWMNPEDAAAFIKNSESPMVCINDHSNMKDFEGAKKIVNAAFKSTLPEKSSFEL